MATEIATADVSLVPSAKGLSQAIHKELVGPTGAVAGDAGHAAGTTFGNRFTGAVSTIAKVGALGLAAVAVGVGKVLFDAVGAAEESRKVVNQTNEVIRSTGAVANVSAAGVSELASALSKKAGIDDELIQSGANVLLTFTKVRNEVGAGNDIFDQATTAALDMSVALGQDMQSSVTQIGKALNDPIAGISALTRVGVQFTDQQKEQIKTLVESGDTLGAQKVILAELNTQFAGSAAGQATASDKLKVALGNISEEIGGVLLPIVDRFATFLDTTLIPAFGTARMIFGAFIGALQGGGVTSDGVVGTFERIGVIVRDVFLTVFPKIQSVVATVFGAIARWVADVVPPIRDWVENVLANLARWWEDNGPLIISIVRGIGAALLAVVTFAKDAANAIVDNWNRVNGPVKAVATVIGVLLIPALVRLGIQATISAAKQAVAWVVTQTGAIRAGVVYAAQTAIMVGHWVFLGAQSLLHAAKVALAWIIATGPVGLAVAAVAAAVFLIIKYWDEISAAVSAAVRWVIDFVTEHWKLLVAIIGGPLGGIVVLIVTHWETIKGAFLAGVDFIVSIWTAAGDAIWAALEFVWGLITTLFVEIPGKVIGWFTGAVSWLWQAGTDILSGLLGGIAGFWLLSVVPWFQGLPDALKGFFTGALDWLLEAGKNIFRGIKNGIAEIWNDVVEFFKGIPQKIMDALGISSPPQWALDTGRFIMEGILRSVGIGAGELLSRLKKVVADASGITGDYDARVAGFQAQAAGARVGGIAGGVGRWAGVALQALALAGQPASYLNDLLTQMAHESGGNPNAINLWDSNAAKGTPSMGLMQTIASTFKAYAGSLVGRGIFDPLANIYAAIQYTVARYGDLGAWRRRGFKGYGTGGILPYTGLFYGHRDEGVFTPDQMRVLGSVGGGRQAGPATVIGPVNVYATTPAEGRAAGRAFLDTLAERRVMVDARIA